MQAVTDWKYTFFGDLSGQLGAAGLAGGLMLFEFESPSSGASAKVLFVGVGVGAGYRISIDTAGRVLELIEKGARPGIGPRALRLSLPRMPVRDYANSAITCVRPFSLNDLHDASGSVRAAGAGMGVGFGGMEASASKHGGTLFRCHRIGIEWGRLGANIVSLNGQWHVLNG